MKIGLCYDLQDDYEAIPSEVPFANFISLNTIAAIKTALEDCGFEVEMMHGLDRVRSVLDDDRWQDVDLFFNIIEGAMSRNREAYAPSLFELAGRPFTGSDSAGTCYAMNKYLTKLVAKDNGILTPEGIVFESMTDDVLREIDRLGYPVVLKANCDEGSAGNAFCADERALMDAFLEDVGLGHREWIVETYIPGKEVTVPVLEDERGPHALGVVLILCEDGSDIMFYDSAKKDDGMFITNTLDFECSEEARSAMRAASEIMHQRLGLRDYSRCDFRLDEQGQPYFLEINPLTALNRKGSFELCGEALGMRYHEVIQSIVHNAMRRNEFR